MSNLLTREQLAERGIAQSIKSCAWCSSWFDMDWNKIPKPEKIQVGMISSGVCPDCLQKMRQQYQKPQ